MMRRPVVIAAWGALLGAVAALVGVAWVATRPGAPGPAAPPDPTVVLADPLVGPRAAAPHGAPSLVLVIGCTLRRDQLSVYGGPAGTTPFLETLAADGARFEDVVAAAPWTRAASTALLVGRHPLSIGMVEQDDSRSERVLPDGVVTLAEHLRDHGWATAGMTTNPNLNTAYGFGQGFDAYRQLEHLWRDEPTKLPGTEAVPMALELLDRLEPGRPFFLLVVLVDSHAPFTADAASRAPFEEPGVPDEVVGYRAVVRRFDRAVQQLDEGLRATGHADDVVLAVVNDHGDGLGWPAHHGKSHGRFLAPSAVGGVFLARGPGVEPGHAIGGMVSQIDVAPTLAGLLGVPMQGVPGLDWSPQLRGEADATSRDRAFTDTWFRDVSRAAVYTPDHACQHDWSTSAPDERFVDGCFDRRADPDHAHPAPLPALEEELATWRREQTREGRSVGDAARAAPNASLDAQLEALGYTKGGE